MHQITRSPSYLIRNPHSYCFRMTVPAELRPLIGKRELRYSLQTGYLRTAKSRARVLAGQVQLLFQGMRRNHRGFMKLTDQQIRDMVTKYLERAKALMDEPFGPNDGDRPFDDAPSLTDYINGLDDVKRDILEEMATGKYWRVKEDALALLQEFGVEASEIDEESPTYFKLCDWLLRAQIKELQYHKNRLSGEFSDDIEHSLDAVLKDDKVKASDVGPKQEMITLQELLTKYMDETSRSAEWKPATEKEYRSLSKMTSFILGPDLPVSNIDHQTMNRFKEVLQTIPSGAFRFKEFRGKSLEELLKIKHDSHLSVARINGYLTSLGAVFRYAVRHGYMKKNFAEGLKLKQRKRANKQQDIFDPGDLKTIFNSPDYIKDRHAEPHRFWLPVLGLFTGCRLEELCQLYLDDIRQIEGLWCLDLKEGRPDQSLKTASSERVVPLHPFLTEELNLIGFAKKLKSRRRIRLFPELKRYQNKYSHYASKWFSEWKTKVGIQAPPREKTFHSFRHTFTDNLKQQLIEVSIVDELTGHAIQGESFGRYGKPYRLKTLLEEGVLKLNYKVDLSHLKSSKWVPKRD